MVLKSKFSCQLSFALNLSVNENVEPSRRDITVMEKGRGEKGEGVGGGGGEGGGEGRATNLRID